VFLVRGGAGLLKGGGSFGPIPATMWSFNSPTVMPQGRAFEDFPRMLPPGYEGGHLGGEAAAGEARSMARYSEATGHFLVWRAGYELAVGSNARRA
jgi:hypothetical protein